MSDSPVKRIEVRKLDALAAHPRQPSLFAEPPAHEVEELAAALRRDGLLCPVEITADGTIIAGHKRVAAARRLGWADVQCWVREDLERQGPEAVERRLVEDNLTRRQLSPLELARCYRALKLLAGRGGLCQGGRADMRDQIGAKLGVSGRHLDRLLRVIEHTPQQVQDAVSSGRLPIALAERVASLGRAQRQQVAAEIGSGQDPAEVVRRHARPARVKHKKAVNAVGSFLRTLARSVSDVEGRVSGVRISLTGEESELLSRASAVIDEIRAQATLAAASASAGAAP